jgi:hypothetical protein
VSKPPSRLTLTSKKSKDLAAAVGTDSGDLEPEDLVAMASLLDAEADEDGDNDVCNQPGRHTFRWFAPPPVDRQMNDRLAYCWQNAFASVRPTFVTRDCSQLRKQYISPVDSNDAQTSDRPLGHSPEMAQQSVSALQWCVQYPPDSRVRLNGVPPMSVAPSSAAKH